MSLLSHLQLQELVKNGVITKIESDQINGTSIDITLGRKILQEVRFPSVVSLRDKQRLPMTEIEMDAEQGYILRPGEFVLAHSEQEFNMPDHLSGEYKLKSSMARIALNHLTAGWCDPWWNGSVLTLELKNESQYHSIRIRPGDRIGQVVFMSSLPVPEEVSYAKRGRYNHDKTVSGIKKDPMHLAPEAPPIEESEPIEIAVGAG